MSRNFDNWLDGYLEYTQHSEAPDRFHFWTGVATISGALGRKVWFPMGLFQWTPNFFVFFVAPPGIVSKSTTASIGMDMLREVEGIHFGPSVITWQALVVAMAEAHQSVEMPDGEYLDQSPIVIVASELGTFLNPRDREMIDVLNDLWDGKQGTWDKITKTGTSEKIVNPWITMVGCTTPAWIADNLSDYFSGGGFASRSVFVYSEVKRKLVAYPKRHMNSHFEVIREALIGDLKEIAELRGEFTMTEEAYQWGEEWYKNHYLDPHDNLSGEKFRGYLARKQTHIHKLAMILSAAKRDNLVIEVEDLIQADKEVTILEEDIPAVYGKMNREKEMIILADVLNFVRANKKGVTKTALYREFISVISIDTFEKVLKSLMAGNLVRQKEIGNDMMVIPVVKEKESGTDSANLDQDSRDQVPQ